MSIGKRLPWIHIIKARVWAWQWRSLRMERTMKHWLSTRTY